MAAHKDIVDRELDKLYKKNNNTISPELVVTAATPANHPLHSYFEWNDTKAAKAHRLRQAYEMILASKMVAFLSKPPQPPPPVAKPLVRKLLPTFRQRGFKMRNEVLSQKETREAFIERKKQALRAWCNEVIDVKELQPLRAMILRAL